MISAGVVGSYAVAFMRTVPPRTPTTYSMAGNFGLNLNLGYPSAPSGELEMPIAYFSANITGNVGYLSTKFLFSEKELVIWRDLHQWFLLLDNGVHCSLVAFAIDPR